MKQYYLGIEFGSTRVRAVLIDGEHALSKSGDYTWKSSLENGVWDIYGGCADRPAHRHSQPPAKLPGAVSAAGHFRHDAHGYLVFDKDWNLLAPFRTAAKHHDRQAAGQLTAEFGSTSRSVGPLRICIRLY